MQFERSNYFEHDIVLQKNYQGIRIPWIFGFYWWIPRIYNICRTYEIGIV
jgi:hypothetical protein